MTNGPPAWRLAAQGAPPLRLTLGLKVDAGVRVTDPPEQRDQHESHSQESPELGGRGHALSDAPAEIGLVHTGEWSHKPAAFPTGEAASDPQATSPAPSGSGAGKESIGPRG